MTLLRFAGVGKQYGARWIVRNVSFHVSAGERWGIVGRNGEGKTTLLRLISGEDAPTEGEIWRHPGLAFTHLRQNRGESSGVRVEEAALEPFAELLRMEARLQEEARALERVEADSEAAQRLLRSYDHHLEQFRRRGGYEARARAHAALEGLGFPPETWQQPIRSLSGGELGRLRLAQTLLAGPEVLLLDEPTNHLDLRSTEWLEGFLQGYSGTVLVVSHDRVFLERLADHILHLEEGTAFAYTGGYESFLEQREERRALQQREFERQREHVARTEEFIRRNIAGQKTNQAKSRRKLLERLERVTGPATEGRAMAIRFDASRRSGGTVLRLEEVVCGWRAAGPTGVVEERVLFPPFSAEVGRGERVAIVGPNGCGKTTLMRALAGEAPPLRGEVVRGAGVRLAYYRQDFTHLDPGHSVWQAVSAAAPARGMEELRAHLARFLFSGEAVEARVGDLSGGEQARVALAVATLRGANLLLLDEPTNHLDIPSREALEEALEQFDGTVVLISHDRAFLSALATRVWGFPDQGPGRIEDYPGGFDDWVAHRAMRPPADAGERRPTGGAPGTAAEAIERPGLSKNEVRRRREELERLEGRIGEVEAELAEAERCLADPALYGAGADPALLRDLALRRDRSAAELSDLYAAWERLGEELATA